MRIEHVASQPDRAGRHLVRFEDGSTMRLYRQTVEDFGLFRGQELTDEDLAKLRTSAGEMSAKMRAVRIVSASGVSKKDLQRRLVQKGEDPGQAKAAVEWMEELQLLDDRKTAEQIVQRCAAKGYGLARAKQALYEKQIPKEYWQEVLENYPDQSEHILAFLRSKLKGDADVKSVHRTVDALLRRGHSYPEIRRCLNQISVDSDTFLEE